MKKHSLRLLTLTLIGILIYSCQKEDDFIDEAQNKEISNIDNSKGAKKLENPYSVENMKKAFENIKTKLNNKQISAKSSSSVSNLEISASHYYIKFKPETQEQEGIIKQDTTMFLSDYPLDWEFTDEYLDNRPELPEGTFPKYYVAVPIDKTLPSNVPYEILEELYIPEEDATFNKKTGTSNKGFTQKGTISNNEDLLRHLLNEAYTLTGNEDDLLEEPNAETNAQARWIFGTRWWPSGTLKIWDDNAGTSTTTTRFFSHWEYYPCDGYLEETPRFDDERRLRRIQEEECKTAVYRYVTNNVKGKYVPLAGAQVLMRQWFTVRQGITDQNGYFKTSSVRGKSRYILQWERYEYSIRSGWMIGQAETRGPKLKKQAWNYNIKGGKAEYYGHIHRAAHHYYYKDIKGLRRPPQNSFWRTQMKIRAYLENISEEGSLGTHNSGWRAFGLQSPIKIYTYTRPSIDTYSTVIHELAHASHWNMNRSSFRDISDNEARIKESWARGVEWELTRMIYPNYRASEIRPKYTLVVMDMIDNDNRFGNTYTFGEAVYGYTIRQIEDALNGQKSWLSWKNNIKNRYNNATENNLDALFNYWD